MTDILTSDSPQYLTPVNVNDANYTVTGINGRMVLYQTLTAPRTVYLPAVTTDGQMVMVVDDKGVCNGTNKITVYPNGADTIEGISYRTLSYPWSSITFKANGTSSWAIIAATDHNSLANLQGGTASEYFHLTSVEYTGTGTGNFVRSNGPVLTGAPTAPTAALGTNTTQIATTAFVLANAGSLPSPVAGWLHDDGTGVHTWTTPTYSQVGAPSTTGTGASGTWGISVTGKAATVTSVTSAQVTSALGYTPVNKAGDSGIGNLSMGALTATTGTFPSSAAVSTTPLYLTNDYGAPASPATSGIIFGRSGIPFASISGGQQVGDNYNYGALYFSTRSSDVLGLVTKLTINCDGAATFSGTVTTGTYLVAGLPAGSAGMRGFVTDALAPTFGATVAGGGAVSVPVYNDGTSWKVG